MSKWHRYKLEEIFDLQMGKTPARVNDEYWNSGEYKWVSIADLTGCKKYISNTKETISEKAVQESGIKCIPENTVIMSFKLSIGKVAITSEKIYSNEAIMAFINKGLVDIDSSYLYHMFSYRDWTDGTNRAVMGITLNKATLSSMEIDIPPIEEQKKIAEILDKASNLISLRKKQIEKLDLLAKARFIEMFGDMDSNPNNFTIVSLDEVCNKITDGKHGGCELEAGSGYYFVGAREIFDGVIHYDTAPEIMYKDFEKDYKRCNIENGDLVIVNTGATIGKTAIAGSPYTEKTLLQKSVALLKTKNDLLLPKFLQYCYITNPKMYRVESASAQPNLLLSRIKQTKIYLPPVEMQNRFVLFVDQINKSKFILQQGLEKLEMTYKALMQQYFN